jgi:hypothetical protein
MVRRFALAAFAAGATLAVALDAAHWPPSAGVEARMRELQRIIGSAEASREERDAARAELGHLLRSPSAPEPSAEPAPPRAAIEPYPPIVKPAVNPPIPMPPVAHVEITDPSRTTLSPSGSALAPWGGGFVVDPRTGAVLHPLPGGGYVDPRTGRITPH